MNDYQQYIALSRYARWLPDEGRRETWEETCNRICDFWIKQINNNSTISEKGKKEILEVIG